jgi:phosphoribosylanthranilate isomerase
VTVYSYFIVNNMIIQIYEVQEPGEAEKLIDFGVDHIGSVIVSKDAWKNPIIRETTLTVEKSSSKSSLIPLFSDLDTVSKVLDYYQPHIVHFCESLVCANNGHIGISKQCPEFIDLQVQIKKRFPEIHIMRSIPVPLPGITDDVPVLELARMFEPVSDYFLIDTLLTGESGGADADQPVNGFVGITGQVCDWDMSSTLVKSSNIPVILAGGLSPENVFSGIIHVQPAGVDSCTRTNATDDKNRPIRFKKDAQNFKRLVA